MRKVADNDHLLHLSFAFREDLAGFQRNKPTERYLQFAKSQAEPADQFAALGSRHRSPMEKSALRAANCTFIVFRSSLLHAGK